MNQSKSYFSTYTQNKDFYASKEYPYNVCISYKLTSGLSLDHCGHFPITSDFQVLFKSLIFSCAKVTI